MSDYVFNLIWPEEVIKTSMKRKQLVTLESLSLLILEVGTICLFYCPFCMHTCSLLAVKLFYLLFYYVIFIFCFTEKKSQIRVLSTQLGVIVLHSTGKLDIFHSLIFSFIKSHTMIVPSKLVWFCIYNKSQTLLLSTTTSFK